ncbi:hypothetical protein [Bradyrhizobium sp. S3.12.5]|uniref:hypothetical protein n=1 Tax=Bradyrhizobium sp. S3.12.5 TaxID=3156386 RepID=UPI003396912B
MTQVVDFNRSFQVEPQKNERYQVDLGEGVSVTALDWRRGFVLGRVPASERFLRDFCCCAPSDALSNSISRLLVARHGLPQQTKLRTGLADKF